MENNQKWSLFVLDEGSSHFRIDNKKVGILGGSVSVEGMSFQRNHHRSREKPLTSLSVFQKVIVKNHKNRSVKLNQFLFIFQSSSSKFMTTFKLAGRQHFFKFSFSKGFVGVMKD
jgi:hypothetical protein